MEHKLPYYMAYPADLREYDEEKREQKDVDYMKSMYPMTAKRLIPYVEEECDRMEYEGSMIYDEYPDRLQLYMMSGRIYDRVKKEEKNVMKDEIEKTGKTRAAEKQEQGMEEEAGIWKEMRLDAQACRGRKCKREEPVMDIIEVLLYHEILRRRCRYRRNRRKFY